MLKFLQSLWLLAWHPNVSMPVDSIVTVAVSSLLGRREHCCGAYRIGANLFLLAVSTWPLATPHSTHVISSLINSLSHTEKWIIAVWPPKVKMVLFKCLYSTVSLNICSVWMLSEKYDSYDGGYICPRRVWWAEEATGLSRSCHVGSGSSDKGCSIIAFYIRQPESCSRGLTQDGLARL